jgi:hypothetical protein
VPGCGFGKQPTGNPEIYFQEWQTLSKQKKLRRLNTAENSLIDFRNGGDPEDGQTTRSTFTFHLIKDGMISRA